MKLSITILTIAVLLASAYIAGRYFTRKRGFSQRTACVGSLIRIRLTKLVYADQNGLTNGTIIPDPVIWRENGVVERCHAGGTYSVNAVGEYPSCSYTGVVRWSGREWRHVWPE